MDSTRKNPSGTGPDAPKREPLRADLPKKNGLFIPGLFAQGIDMPKSEIRLHRATSAVLTHKVPKRTPLPLSRPAFIAALLVMVSDLPRPMPTAQWNSMTANERMFYLHHHNVTIRDPNSRIVDSMTHIEFDRIAPVGHVIRLDKKGNRYV